MRLAIHASTVSTQRLTMLRFHDLAPRELLKDVKVTISTFTRALSSSHICSSSSCAGILCLSTVSRFSNPFGRQNAHSQPTVRPRKHKDGSKRNKEWRNSWRSADGTVSNMLLPYAPRHRDLVIENSSESARGALPPGDLSRKLTLGGPSEATLAAAG